MHAGGQKLDKNHSNWPRANGVSEAQDRHPQRSPPLRTTGQQATRRPTLPTRRKTEEDGNGKQEARRKKLGTPLRDTQLERCTCRIAHRKTGIVGGIQEASKNLAELERMEKMENGGESKYSLSSMFGLKNLFQKWAWIVDSFVGQPCD